MKPRYNTIFNYWVGKDPKTEIVYGKKNTFIPGEGILVHWNSL